MSYTYLHRRADTNAVFYIGKGTGRRAGSRAPRSDWWKRIVAKAGGFTAQILATWPTEAEAFEHEKFLIACFRAMDVELCNAGDGGAGGASGHKHTPGTIAKMRAAHLGKVFSEQHRARISAANRARSPETRRKIGAASASRRHTPSARAKISAALLGRPCSPTTRAKIGSAARARRA